MLYFCLHNLFFSFFFKYFKLNSLFFFPLCSLNFLLFNFFFNFFFCYFRWFPSKNLSISFNSWCNSFSWISYSFWRNLFSNSSYKLLSWECLNLLRNWSYNFSDYSSFNILFYRWSNISLSSLLNIFSFIILMLALIIKIRTILTNYFSIFKLSFFYWLVNSTFSINSTFSLLQLL